MAVTGANGMAGGADTVADTLGLFHPFGPIRRTARCGRCGWCDPANGAYRGGAARDLKSGFAAARMAGFEAVSG